MKKYRLVERGNGYFIIQRKNGLFREWHDINGSIDENRAKELYEEYIIDAILEKQSEQNKKKFMIIKKMEYWV